jgi:hypothetical protein
MTGRLDSTNDVQTYITAGNATITLRSKISGKRYTYKIKAMENKDGTVAALPDRGYFVNLLTGPDNNGDFTYIGILTPQLNLRLTPKSRMHTESSPVQAFRFLLTCLSKGGMPGSFEVWHAGKCGRCGRKLTVPESVARGIGPDCAEMMGGGL